MSKDKNRKEDRQINFRVSEQEYQRLKNMADDVGGFCKNKVLGVKTRVPTVSKTEAVQIASELRRIGVNVNQVSKHLNSFQIDSSTLYASLRGIREEMKNIWLLLS